MARVVIATTKSWNIDRYQQWATNTKHVTRLFTQPSELTLAAVHSFAPDYVFFPHWSWKIPAAIYESYECVVFHMTDLPFGRGGSPLQNLLLQEVYDTQMSALRVVEVMDAGPIYLKHPFSLHGSAEEIYVRAADLVFQMIDEILEHQPTPVPQQGEVVEFKRRAAAESEIPTRNSLTALYDFIRMLDAEGYPAAFFSHEGFRYEFSHATLRDGHIAADVKIFPIEKPSV